MRSPSHGRCSPSGGPQIALAANSQQVMSVVLRLAGHAELKLGIKLQEISRALELALAHVRAIAGPQ